MSLWESSFVTKQSHLDSSGKRPHALPHLSVKKSPSGSAGHVSHMSACGCLGFSALYTYANAHTRLLPSTCAHHRSHRSPLNVTRIASQWRADILRFGVRFLCQSGLLSSLQSIPVKEKPKAKSHFLIGLSETQKSPALLFRSMRGKMVE